MGKPRLIILIRHAQSEGNKNRAIHQLVPDHRVKLTDEGWTQAEEAGRRLRDLLRPDDTLQIFTSPYRRTRETTEGILRTLTSHHASENPSPFSRHKIKVYEEPRLREQDFGNFQPDSAEMERMWKERADYGHFFYRIPNGESAADAYDRVSGFNESLWRQFGEKEFPSVLVLVTHGLMTRVFLMKWYHWSVEYFEDLRNINHCEFILMKQNMETGKYSLESQLRTWSELKRQRQENAATNDPSRRNTLSAFLKQPEKTTPPPHAWGWSHDGSLSKRSGDIEKGNGAIREASLPLLAQAEANANSRASDNPLGDDKPTPTSSSSAIIEDNTPNPKFNDPFTSRTLPSHLATQTKPRTTSGLSTPHEMPSDEEVDYFPAEGTQPHTTSSLPAAIDQPGRRTLNTALNSAPERKPTPEDINRWIGESGMGAGRHADALGDEPDREEEVEDNVRVQREKEDGVRGSVY